MIVICPHCGHNLPQSLADGIANCPHCSRIFDSNPYNKLLSAAWLARKQHFTNADQLIRYGCSEEEAIMIEAFVIENGFNHQEFERTLKNFGVGEQINIDDAFQTC